MYSPPRNRNAVLAILVVVAILLLILHQLGQLAPLENFAMGWFQPILRAALGVREGVQGASGTFADVAELRAQIDALQRQVSETANSRVRILELENENTILRKQLGYKQSNPDFDLIGAAVLERNPDLARVVGQDPSNLAWSIIVDQGSANGVKTGMPVITPEGLVGRVISTGTNWAKVLLIIDPSSSVNAAVQSTRATGVVQGNIADQFIIKYVPQGEAIKTGDLIISSGMGGTFPKRLVIGTVMQVRKHDIELFQEATIKPAVDFTRLEFVLILKKFTPSDITQEPTPSPTPKPTPTRTPTPGA